MSKTWIQPYAIALFCLGVSTAFAAEPVNLAITKQELVAYHDSGEYLADFQRSVNDALGYLQMRLADQQHPPKNPAIILDIDETSLSNYPSMLKLSFGGTLQDIIKAQDKGQDPALIPTLKLYEFAKANHIAVFFLTGRYEYERGVTALNLQKAGYNSWDGLILRSKAEANLPAAQYKTAHRQQLAAQGYDILLNMGDQTSDLKGGFADKTIKLPNPYYFIP